MDPQNNTDDRHIAVPQRQPSPVRPPEREAAAQIMRQQIDQLYAEDANSTQPASPYHQTHSEEVDHRASEQQAAEQWRQYHSQWQNYYQQYYERYYKSQLAARQQKLAGHQLPETTAGIPAMVTAGEPIAEPLSKSQAARELRNELLEKVRLQTARVRSSRHFVPIAAAVIVALTFAFLQYNALIFAQIKTYVSPGSINPANLIIDPTTDTKVGPEPKIIIPKINVEYSVSYDLTTIAESAVESKLKQGVVHYPIPGASAVPGQKGNTVILGHSSNDVFDDGVAKFAFVQLNALQPGDTFYLNYQGTRYTYSVTGKKIIKPTEVSQLVTDNSKAMATLVTCDPPGTAINRLVVFADQVSPDPDAAAVNNNASNTEDTKNVTIPGNSPTLFERLFGGQ